MSHVSFGLTLFSSDYFKFRYDEKWLGGITQFFVDKGYVTEEELAARIAEPSPMPDPEATQAIDDQAVAYLRKGDSPRRDVAHPKFPVGSAVQITNAAADEHSRLPGYLRGRTGTVERVFEGDYAYFTHTGDGIGDPLYAELFEAYLAPIEEES